MPTAAKLIAALIFGASGGAAAFYGAPELPDDMSARNLLPLAILVSAWTGWRVMGRHATRRNFGRNLGLSITTTALSVLATLGIAAIYEMLYRATKKRYGDSMEEAFADASRLFLQYLSHAAILPVLQPLVIGLLAGAVVVPLSKRLFN